MVNNTTKRLKKEIENTFSNIKNPLVCNPHVKSFPAQKGNQFC